MHPESQFLVALPNPQSSAGQLLKRHMSNTGVYRWQDASEEMLQQLRERHAKDPTEVYSYIVEDILEEDVPDEEIERRVKIDDELLLRAHDYTARTTRDGVVQICTDHNSTPLIYSVDQTSDLIMRLDVDLNLNEYSRRSAPGSGMRVVVSHLPQRAVDLDRMCALQAQQAGIRHDLVKRQINQQVVGDTRLFETDPRVIVANGLELDPVVERLRYTAPLNRWQFRPVRELAALLDMNRAEYVARHARLPLVAPMGYVHHADPDTITMVDPDDETSVEAFHAWWAALDDIDMVTAVNVWGMPMQSGQYDPDHPNDQLLIPYDYTTPQPQKGLVGEAVGEAMAW